MIIISQTKLWKETGLHINHVSFSKTHEQISYSNATSWKSNQFWKATKLKKYRILIILQSAFAMVAPFVSIFPSSETLWEHNFHPFDTFLINMQIIFESKAEVINIKNLCCCNYSFIVLFWIPFCPKLLLILIRKIWKDSTEICGFIWRIFSLHHICTVLINLEQVGNSYWFTNQLFIYLGHPFLNFLLFYPLLFFSFCLS